MNKRDLMKPIKRLQNICQKKVQKAEVVVNLTTGKGTTLPSSSFPKISVSGLKYADLDGDGTADGIIVADISKDSTDTTTYKGKNPWGNRNGSFSYTEKETSREYSENTYEYTNADGYKVKGTMHK